MTCLQTMAHFFNCFSSSSSCSTLCSSQASSNCPDLPTSRPRNLTIDPGTHKKKSLRSSPAHSLRWMMVATSQCDQWWNWSQTCSCSLTLHGHHLKSHHTNAHCSPGRLNQLISHLGPHTDVASFASLLQLCTIEKSLPHGELVHQHMTRLGYADNTFLNNLLVQMYSKCGRLQDARDLFHNMVSRNSFSWTIMLTACAKNGHSKDALQLFDQMQSEGLEPTEITFICVLDACASMEALEEGRHIHAIVVGNGWESYVVVGTALINMYGNCKSMDDVRAVFAEMPQRDVVCWSAMITMCVQNGYGKEALWLFDQMQTKGLEPDKVTFICVLDACASVAAAEEGQGVHADVVRNGWESVVVVGNALLNMYGKCGSLDDARAVFAEMPQQDVVSWNAMIAVCTQNGQGKEALELFGQMQNTGFVPDKITLTCVLDACASMASLEEGLEIHATAVGNGWDCDARVENALINMYGKNGSLSDARAVFADMPWRDVVSWSAMIAACAQNGCSKEALQLFGQMEAESIKPNEITFICILTACSHMGLVADGRQYFASMSQSYHLSPSVEHYVCMIDLLGRAGQLEKAEQLINSMPFEPAASAWSSLLSSCNIHGDVERGIRSANHIFYLDKKDALPYVVLANIHAGVGHWDSVEK